MRDLVLTRPYCWEAAVWDRLKRQREANEALGLPRRGHVLRKLQVLAEADERLDLAAIADEEAGFEQCELFDGGDDA